MNSKAKVPVLLIEDNPQESKNILHLLEDASIRCITHHVETLFEGLDFIQNHQIRIVLLDLTLPDSNGFKTLTTFLKKAPHTPVIVLAETNNEIVGNQSIKAGAQDFLVKRQFDARTLGRSIRYALQRFSTHVKLKSIASELSISEKRYVEAQEMAHFGNWEMDIVSNEMKWTEEVYRIMGFQPNSFTPTLSEYLNYVHIEDKEKVEAFFEYVSKDGKLHKLEHRIIIDGHNFKHVALSGKINFEESSNKLVLVGVIQDITERKLNEKLILEKNFSNRTTKVMQQAMADMSFNVRTPLSSIINFIYLLKDTALSSQQLEFINALKESVDDMSLVLNNLFNFAVLANEDLKLDKEEFKLKDFLISNEKVLQRRSDSSNVVFEFMTDGNIPEKIKVDPKKLSLIFYNLVNFLSQNQDEKGKISIFTHIDLFSSTSGNLSLKFHRNQFKLSLQQIKELQDSEKLLEVYDPNDKEQDNISINIAVVLKLVKLLGGKLDIKNEVADWTSFLLEIPVNIVETRTLGETGKPDTALKILLVEDHFLNQIATKKVLKAWSKWISVDIAENGLVAVEKHREYQYDIIVMDIQMPIMDGIEASKKIREKSNVPIIALTANSSKQEQDRCHAVGIDSYMSKPFKPNELYEKIMQLMVKIPARKEG